MTSIQRGSTSSSVYNQYSELGNGAIQQGIIFKNFKGAKEKSWITLLLPKLDSGS
jgi:hypothetical protein